jgi:myo-inositol 2-dehydrogenase/D-chiro-inositol 1-dehydrogenase
MIPSSQRHAGCYKHLREPEMAGIGLLGCGRIGQVHARSISQIEGATVTAVADAFAEPAQALADSTGAQVLDPLELIESTEVDAVVIGTPTDTHYDLIHAAARAGKAIFCEKPVDLSSDRIRDCIAAVERAGVPFLTAFNRRFDPNFADLQTRLRQKQIGEVEIVTIQSRDPSPPPVNYIQSSGGLFRDMMIHDLDMARFLLGEEMVRVYAVGSALIDPEIGRAGDVDTAAVTLTTASGKICQITNSRRASYGYDQRIEVHGSGGMLRAENVHETTVEIATQSGFTRAPAQHFFLERYKAAYHAEMSHFVAAIETGSAPTPSLFDGLQAQLLADAATRSWAEGRPVDLT